VADAVPQDCHPLLHLLHLQSIFHLMNSASISRITQIPAHFGFSSQLALVIEGLLNVSLT
jgi:hypothetical protein